MVNPANKPGCYALFGNSGIKEHSHKVYVINE